MHGITNSVNMSLNKLQEMVKDRDVWCAAVHEVAKSWTIKRRIDTFELVALEKTLESPLDCKEIEPVNPKGNQS